MQIARLRSAAGVVHLSWARAPDGASGVARYDVSLDGRGAGSTRAQKLDVAAGGGSHVFAIVAVDRAGNRSRSASRRFVVTTR
jgi:hypothetical protein